MAEAMGISTFRYKLVVFVLAAVLAAVSGWLFAFFQRTSTRRPSRIGKGIEYLFMAVLGGVSPRLGRLPRRRRGQADRRPAAGAAAAS
jgi:ABC-type branched-subunit amino acid transport system permease subunit